MSNDNKVYAIVYDNGEAWEDGFSYTVAIYNTREAAENYLDLKYRRDGENRWVNRHDVKKCSKGHTYDECDNCPVCIDWENNGYQTEYACPEQEEIQDSYFNKAYDYAWYEIEEWELKE